MWHHGAAIAGVVTPTASNTKPLTDVARSCNTFTAGGGSWSDGALAELVSTLAGQVAGDAAARNFNRWPLGSTSTNNRFVTVPPAKGSWEEEVRRPVTRTMPGSKSS